MYAPSYSPFGQGQPPPGFNPSAPQQQHQQPQQPQQQQQQQQQHMMFNQQQFPQGPHQSPYGGVPNPNMNPNMMMPNGPMMQNGGMAHMAGNNGIAPYQTPYTSSPYGPGITPSSSAGPTHQGPFMPPNANPQFNINAQSMTPQQHQQRMHPPPATTPVNQRVSPYNGGPHNTPPHAQPQSQFMTPQGQSQNQNQTQQPQQQQPQNDTSVQRQTQQGNSNPQSAGGQTPQTPSFPNNAAANVVMAPPLSPGAESREKERVTTLLDINRELLLEVIRLQGVQAEAKKDAGSAANGEKDTVADKAKADKVAATSKEYIDCMRRLQYNLAYLAAIADRSHKPSSQTPPHPAIMMAPILTILPKARPSPAVKSKEEPAVKDEHTNSPLKDKLVVTPNEPPAQDRIASLQALYKRLQSLFPDVKDYTKEPPLQPAAGKGRPPPGAQSGQQLNPNASHQPGQQQPQHSQHNPNNSNPQASPAPSQQKTPKMPNQQGQLPQQQGAGQGQMLQSQMAQVQAHQMQAQQIARQQQAQVMSQGQMNQGQNQGGMNPNMGGGFNPNMMPMNGINGMPMSMGGNMSMQNMSIPNNMMGGGGGMMPHAQNMNPAMMGGFGPQSGNNMMGPGQAMGMTMNPAMMGGMQGPNQGQNPHNQQGQSTPGGVGGAGQR